MATLTDHDVIAEFHHVVNLRADELEGWLATPESRAVGLRHGSAESVGHRSGRRIVALLGRTGYDDQDLAHMRAVIGFVHRHLAQRPRGDLSNTAWRFSLMNWGHDPLRD